MKLIFVHTPKTGGTSAVSALRRCAKHWSGRYGHSPLCNTIVADAKLNRRDIKIVAVVRNPWDRLLSGYFYLMQGGSNRRDFLRKILAMPILRGEFNDFVTRLRHLPFIYSPSPLCDIAWAPHLWPFLHILPQSYWLCSADRNVLLVDKLLRFENLANELQELVSESSGNILQIPHLNESVHPHYREVYSRNTVEIVRKIFQKDIEHFGYQF